MVICVLEFVQYLCLAILCVGVPIELWRRYKGESPYDRAVRELRQKFNPDPDPEKPKPKPKPGTENESS